MLIINKVLGSTIDKPISIGRNELCPCGSGKKFKTCCQSKDHEYAEFTGPNGKRAIIDSTEKSDVFTEMDEFIDKSKINEYYQQGKFIDVNLGMEYLNTLYMYFDKLIKPIHAISSCKKGCSACCKLVVSASALEAEVIRNFIINKLDKVKIKEIYRKIAKNKNAYPDALKIGSIYSDYTTGTFMKSNIPCPFLSDKNTCLVYEARPFACRKYLVFSTSEICKLENEEVIYYNAGYFNSLIEIIELLNSIIYKDLNYTKHLPSWFLKDKFYEKKFKRINLIYN